MSEGLNEVFPPIVVVAYARAHSMQRLLDSLNGASYPCEEITLIISIDKGDNEDVVRAAEEFHWRHGKKTVRLQKENLKLRRHVLQCGDYALEYGSVIVLEDDLYVSPHFYEYAVRALKASRGDGRIGGISLYNHRLNVMASEPFEAIDDGFDNWYFQFASSWGEVWTREQWSGFKVWYEADPDIRSIQGVPRYVRNWPESSWLKYFIAYLVEKNMYFFYPRLSLATNFGDAGTHVMNSNTEFQVPLQLGPKKYNFSSPDESGSVYDAFMENNRLYSAVPDADGSVVVDLYGVKEGYGSARYALTRKGLPFHVERSYGCCLRPHEANVLDGIPGADFFLYDLTRPERRTIKEDRPRKAQYNLRRVGHGQYLAVLQLFARKALEGFRRRMKRKGGK